MTLQKTLAAGKWTITLATMMTISGCGAFKTKNKGEKAKENDKALTGEWKDGCIKGDWLGLTHEQADYKFSALGDFDHKTTLYRDDACKAADVTLAEHGTYASLGTSASVPNATDINFTVTKAEVTPQSDDAAKLLNDASYCGITAWQKGHAEDVVGKSCLGKDHAKGEVSFDVYRIDNDGRRLTLGKDSLFLGKSDAGSRPGKLDDSRIFDKQ